MPEARRRSRDKVVHAADQPVDNYPVYPVQCWQAGREIADDHPEYIQRNDQLSQYAVPLEASIRKLFHRKTCMSTAVRICLTLSA